MERMESEEAIRFRILVRCDCYVEDCTFARPQGGSEVMFAPKARTLRANYWLSTRSPLVAHPSAQNSVALARDFFPRVMRESGMELNPLQSNWPALANNLKRWHTKYEMGYDLIRRMMEEFPLHPEWCRKSVHSTWRGFVSRRQDMVDRVLAKDTYDQHWYRHTSGASLPV